MGSSRWWKACQYGNVYWHGYLRLREVSPLDALAHAADVVLAPPPPFRLTSRVCGEQAPAHVLVVAADAESKGSVAAEAAAAAAAAVIAASAVAVTAWRMAASSLVHEPERGPAAVSEAVRAPYRVD